MKVLVFFFFFFFPFSKNDEASLKIEISGVRNMEGAIKIGLYNYENQFPYQPYKSFAVEKENLKNGVLTFGIDSLVPGKYAISLLDDENMNNEMDYNWLGIPQEGYGFSNNAKPGLLGPPSYVDCLFSLSNETKVQIKIKYF